MPHRTEKGNNKTAVGILAPFEMLEYHFIITPKLQRGHKTTARFSAPALGKHASRSRREALGGGFSEHTAFNARWLKVEPQGLATAILKGNEHNRWHAAPHEGLENYRGICSSVEFNGDDERGQIETEKA